MAEEVGRACLQECKRMGYEGALYYGMVKEYADTRGWGIWEVFREFVQNALDEMHEVMGRRPTNYPCKYRRDIRGVVIYDTGRGIATYNLYIGKSEKKMWQRGKFGEGLKIALLTAVANNIKVIVQSGDKEFKPILATEMVENVPLKVFCICVKKMPTLVTGTQVLIYGVGNLCTKFWDRIVQGVMERKPQAVLVVHEHPAPHYAWRDLIDKTATRGEAVIYARDIYVSQFKEATGRDACYSYNFYDIKLDESRRIASLPSVIDDMWALWRYLIDEFEPEKADVDERQKKVKEALKNFLNCVIRDCKESNMFESSYMIILPWFIRSSPDRQRKIRLLLDELIGKDTIIVYDPDLAKLADYLEIPYIHCSTVFGNSAQGWFDLAAIFEAKLKEKEKEIIPKDRIEPRLRERLEILEEIARIVFEPPDVKVEYMIASKELRGRIIDTPTYKAIVINLQPLASECERSPYHCLSTFLSIYGHELAHILSGAGDLTKEHMQSLTDLMGRALANAMVKSAKLSILFTKLAQTYVYARY